MKSVVLLILASCLIGASQPRTDKQLRWFRAFAEEPSAQTAVANELWQQQQRTDALYWWQRAAHGGSAEALDALIKHFPRSSQQWLRLGVEHGDHAAIQQLAEQQLHDPNVSWQQWQQRWLTPSYLDALGTRYTAVTEYLTRTDMCREPIAVVAASAAEKGRFVTLLTQLQELELPTQHWCFNWQIDAELSCQRQQGSLRADCASTLHQRRIVLTDYGKASSSPQQITLTNDSTGEVLAHELGHWLGLADEYAMSAPLAEAFCRGDYDFRALNVVVTQQRQLTTEQLKLLWQRLPWQQAVDDWRALAQPLANGRWQLGSDNEAIGLYPAATCEQVEGYTAWKPVKAVTAMEQHQQRYWPALYLHLMNQNRMAN